MPKVVFKIPGNVVQRHPELQERSWKAGDMVEFSSIVEGGPKNIELEVYSLYGTLWIRSADAGSMNRLRRYSNSLGGSEPVSGDEVSKVLKKRNPSKELRVEE